MLVSIIIPAYQAELYIERCITSAINQTLETIEVIVIDNGSTDHTPFILDNIAIHHQNVQIIHQNNLGIIEAKKNGLAIARGEYILFMDSDDWLHPQAVEKLYARATKKNADIVLFHAYKVKNHKFYQHKTYTDNIQLIEKNPLLAFFQNKISPPLWFKLIKKSYLEQQNIKFPSFVNHCEDTAVTTSLFIHNPNVTCLPEHLYFWYQHANSLSSIYHNRLTDIEKVLDFMTNELTVNELFPEYEIIYKEYIFGVISWIYNRTIPSLKPQLVHIFYDWILTFDSKTSKNKT